MTGCVMLEHCNESIFLDCIKKTDEFNTILKNWLESYVQSKDKKDTEWITLELSKVLPDLDNKEAATIATDIVDYVDSIMAARADLQKSKDRGMSRKEWLYRKFEKSAKDFSENEFGDLVGSFGNGVLKEFQNSVNNFDMDEEKGKSTTPARHLLIEPDVLPPQGWNDANIKDRIFDTSKVLNMLTVLGLSRLNESVQETGSGADVSPLAKEISEALLKGDASGAVKALTGALKEAHDKKILVLDSAFPVLKDAAIHPKSKLPPDISHDDSLIFKFDPATPVLTSLSDMAVELIRLTNKVASGEIKAEDALDVAADQAVSAAGGMAETVCAKYGSKAGKAIGAFLGGLISPAGAVIGANIGSRVGGFLGEKVARSVQAGLRKLGEKAKEIGHTVVEGVCSTGRAVVNGVKNVVSSIGSACKSAGSFICSLFG